MSRSSVRRAVVSLAFVAPFVAIGCNSSFSGASFVLQNLYGLTPFNFGVAFALGSVGYMAGARRSGASR